MGRMKTREKVFIHSGAGGVGQAAIQLALLAGTTVLTTVSSTEKKEFLLRLYPDLVAAHIWIGRGASFMPWLSEQCPEGVDLVLNSYSGDGLHPSLQSLAPNGRFLDISRADIQSSEHLSMSVFARNISYTSIDISALTEESSMLISDLLANAIRLFSSSKINIP